jgi:hypothetical protein
VEAAAAEALEPAVLEPAVLASLPPSGMKVSTGSRFPFTCTGGAARHW